MRNIFVVFNGVDYSPHVLNFAIFAAKQNASVLHPIFLKPLHVEESLQYPFPNDLSGTQSLFSRKELDEEDQKGMDANLQVFIDECKENDLQYKTERKLETLEELIDLTAFADLTMVDARSEIGKYSVIDLLTDAHCPTILVPATSQLPDKIVLCYDGSASSMYAIKMYSYLFPEWKNKPTELLTINPPSNDKDETYMDDWCDNHFTNLAKHQAQGNVHQELINFIQPESEKKLIVMGAFGRSALSRLLHRSLAARVIEETSASLFITHQ